MSTSSVNLTRSQGLVSKLPSFVPGILAECKQMADRKDYQVEKLNDFAFRELLGHGSVDANTTILYTTILLGIIELSGTNYLPRIQFPFATITIRSVRTISEGR